MENINTKVCNKCKIEKDIILFSKDKSKKDGFHTHCKECIKEYQQNNKEAIAKQRKIYDKEYYQNNKEQKKIYNKEYYQNNKEVLAKRQKEYERNKRQIDINYKLSKNLRSRLLKVVKRNQKKGSAVRDLGCSIDELKIHLEKQFQPGMTWDNHGTWHIDHIIPLSSFDLTDREQLLKAVHFTNLQPLWAKDNFAKGAKTI